MQFTVVLTIEADDPDAAADIVGAWRLSAGAVLNVISGVPRFTEGLPLTAAADGDIAEALRVAREGSRT